MTEDVHHVRIRDQFAQRIATYEHAARWMLSEDLIKAQREMIGPAPEGAKRAIDLCCGTGIVGRNLLDLGWEMQGLDLTPEMGFVASEYFPVKIGSVEKMDFKDASFDLATLRQSFMLVHGSQTLKEIYRVLRPGGRFVLIQSTAYSDLDNVVYAKVQGARHINQRTYYRSEDLHRALSEHGFTIEKERGLSVRESVDHWLDCAPELSPDRRGVIRGLIQSADAGYKRARRVEEIGGELFEDWNWLILVGRKD